MKSNVKEKIITVLKEHPEGLTILNISKIVGMSRVTISKYVYGMIAENAIHERKIGPAKLCCLKEIK